MYKCLTRLLYMMASRSISSVSRSAGTKSSYGSFRPLIKDSITVYHSPDPFRPLIQQDDRTQLHSNKSVKNKVFSWRRKIRRIRSKGAILVLIWSFLMWGVLSLTWSDIHFSATKQHNSTDMLSFKHTVSYIAMHYVIMLTVFMIGTPLSGWLADVYFGRYKVIQGSVWLMLFGYVIHSVVELMYIYTTTSNDKSEYSAGVIILIIIHLVGSLLQWSGTAGFLSNAIQFGIDQMSDASTSEVSAFIFWYVFALNFGAWTVTVFNELLSLCVRDQLLVSASQISGFILPVFCVSMILCSNYLLRHSLTAEPHTHNPLKLVLEVLKYAATHSKVQVRSAFTYMDMRPSRLDLGKSKFGGPFTTEQVEDVKTFLRILLLMCPTSLIIIAVSQIQMSLEVITEHINGFSPSCDGTTIATFLYNHNLLVALCIVLYELVIYPLFSRRISTMLRRIGTSACFLCLLTVILLIVDTVGHIRTNGNVPCMFEDTKSNVTNFDIPLFSVEVPANILLALVLGLLSTATYEFVCAQSPYSMRGILIGFAWFTYTLSFGLGDLITQIWKNSWREHPIKDIPSCGLLFYSSILFIALVGLVLFGLAACCYKMRIRDEIRNERAVIEEVYAKRCAMENSIN